jgi:hypothetical protein
MASSMLIHVIDTDYMLRLLRLITHVRLGSVP